MAQLELNLDAFLASTQQAHDDGINLPAIVTVASLSGVDGFSLSYDGRSSSLSEKDLELIIASAMDIRFALRIAPRAELFQLALSLPVKQVTFSAANIFESYGTDLESFIPQLKEAGKLVSFHLDAELPLLKKAYRLQADLVELNGKHYTENTNPTGQVEAQEQLALMAKTAEKNGIGVAIEGSVNYQNVVPLISIDAVENVVSGRAIFNRAVFVGLETAIRDFKSQVL